MLFALSAATEPNENSFRTRHSLTLDLFSPLQRNENRPKSPDIFLDILSPDASQTTHERKRRGIKFFAPPNYPPRKNQWRPSKRPRKLKHIPDTIIHDIFDESHTSKDFGPVIHLEDDFESLNEIIDYADEVSSDHTLFDVHDFVPSHPPHVDNDHHTKTFFESNEFHHDNSDEHFQGNEHSTYPGTSFFSDEVHHESKPDNHISIHSTEYSTDGIGDIHSSSHPSSHEKFNSGFHHSSHGEVPLHFNSNSHEFKPSSHPATSYHESSGNGNSHLSHVMNNKLYYADVPTKVVTNDKDRVTEGGSTHLTPGGIKGLKPSDYSFISEKTKPYVLGQAQY